MNALLINCSPVRNGATAEIVNIYDSGYVEMHTFTFISTLCSILYNFHISTGATVFNSNATNFQS